MANYVNPGEITSPPSDKTAWNEFDTESRGNGYWRHSYLLAPFPHCEISVDTRKTSESNFESLSVVQCSSNKTEGKKKKAHAVATFSRQTDAESNRRGARVSLFWVLLSISCVTAPERTISVFELCTIVCLLLAWVCLSMHRAFFCSRRQPGYERWDVCWRHKRGRVYNIISECFVWPSQLQSIIVLQCVYTHQKKIYSNLKWKSSVFGFLDWTFVISDDKLPKSTFHIKWN